MNDLRTAARRAVLAYFNAEDAEDDAATLEAMTELRRFWTWFGGAITGDALLSDTREPDSLDAAWAEAEAALPDEWGIEIVPNLTKAPAINGAWIAMKVRDMPWRGFGVYGSGDTPAAALRALTARLSETSR